MAYATEHLSDNAAASNLIRIRNANQLESFPVDGSFDVRGRVAPKAKSFAISLGTDASNLYICFKADLTKGIIKCHYKEDGKCGQEVTGRSCPFHEGQEVKITFLFEATDSGSIVTVNLPDHTHFRFSNPVRLNINKYVKVDGDFRHYPDLSK
ncbi:galectin-1-like [Eublepharis macularius]|uniref:Galectin n=1 Tax=Eublepharis macularius TaxID=481883 RepID=A0AA97KSZ2_EUBMA|nr:galectin-1-like [Eublepharis macularius]XP_054830480.1 galectin-1-like [Eublepharis macularius]